MTGEDRQSESGFTLMEMLTVLAIMALVAAVSLPFLKASSPGKVFRAQAQEISALFRLARVDAITGNRETRIIVDLTNRRVTYEGRANAILLAPETNIQVKTARGEVMSDDAGFRFMPGGGATGGAIVLQRDGNKVTIAISWLTGAVAIDYGNVR